MYSTQQICTFRNIMEFLDTSVPIEYTQQPNAFVNNIANVTNEEEQNIALMKFTIDNACAWTSDMYMDINKCKTVEIVFEKAPSINLKDLFVYLSDYDKKRFWLMVCMCIGRTSAALAEKRQAMLCSSVQEFQKDLASINIEMKEDDIIRFVSTNKDAIATRYIARLNQQIPLDKMDYEPFWCHMEKIYNIINPYDQILFKPSSSHTIVTTMVDKISGMFNGQNMEDGNIDFGQIVGSLLNADMMQQMSQLMQGSNPKELVSTILSVLPEMNQIMPSEESMGL